MLLTVTMNVAIDKRYVVGSLTPGSVIRVQECQSSAGGKGLNVSRVAKIAGEDVLAIGIIGGHAGEYILEALGQQGIATDFVTVKGESRSCVNIYDESTGKQTELLEPGVTATEEDVARFIAKFTSLLPQSEAVVISGSVPRGVENDFYAKLIAIAKAQKKPVLLDASGELLRQGISAKPDFIKPNREELLALLNHPIETEAEIIAAATQFCESGIGMAAVSLGKEGVILVCPSGVYRGETPDVPVVNTVGCGDSMVAAFAVGIARGLPIAETLRLALAISTANALRPETGFYDPADLDYLLPLVQVKQL
jgi:tagatose 6-phosphate kinase